MSPEATRGAGAAVLGYPHDLRVLVEEYLEDLRFAHELGTAGLEESMRYSLLSGGKRIRPVLALATARAVGRDPREVLPLAAAIELIHTFSLIHNDLPAIDDDELRRGRPTAHRRFGEDVAILAGDALFAEAFRLVLRRQWGEPARVLASVAELADATGVAGMAGGEYIDVRGLAREEGVGLRRLHRLKTGRLIGASIESVLLLVGTPDPTLLAFRAFAGELGMLFQIGDDILDVAGNDAELGKATGSDARHGKVTYVSRYGLAGARAQAVQTHGAARDALALAVPGGAVELVQISDFMLARTT